MLELLMSVNYLGRAVLVQSTFSHNQFRFGFDLIAAPVLGPPGGDVWQECPSMLPARRTFLLSFQGEVKTQSLVRTTPSGFDDSDLGMSKNFSEMDKFIVQHLKDMDRGTTNDRYVYFQTFGRVTSELANLLFHDKCKLPIFYIGVS